MTETRRGTAPPPPGPSLNQSLASKGVANSADAKELRDAVKSEQPATKASAKPRGRPRTATGVAKPEPEPVIEREQPAQPAPAQAKSPIAPFSRSRAYDPAYCDLVIEYMADNHGLTAFAGLVNVTPDLVYKWAREIPEFGEACAIGKGKRAGVLEEKLDKPRSGPEIAGTIFAIKNAVPNEYRDRVELVTEGMTDAAIKATAEAVRTGVKDAMQQLGQQAMEAMKGIRVIDHGTGKLLDAELEPTRKAIRVRPGTPTEPPDIAFTESPESQQANQDSPPGL